MPKKSKYKCLVISNIRQEIIEDDLDYSNDRTVISVDLTEPSIKNVESTLIQLSETVLTISFLSESAMNKYFEQKLPDTIYPDVGCTLCIKMTNNTNKSETIKEVVNDHR